MAKKLVILGAGESGIGAALLGRKEGYDLLVSDNGQINDETKALFQKNDIPFEEGGHSEKIFEAEIVVKSPGIPDTISLIQNLLARGAKVISEIEFAFQHINKEAKVIAITGTNGKTTTTLLTHHLMSKAGLDVALGGNVGVSLARILSEKEYEYYVVEVSSFQLDGIITFRPDVAVLLNITPDHLDRYNNEFKQYVKSKFKITENLTKEECFIYCSDSVAINEELSRRNVEACLFAISASNQENTSAYIDTEHLIFDFKFKNKGRYHKIPLTEISLIGKHNMINTMAAVLSALSMEVPIEKILKGLKSFRNAPHRLEYVEEIDGVRFVNDSKATNVDSVFYALDAIKENIIWIAGGVDKGNEYDQILPIVKEKVKSLICLGKDNEKLTSFFGNVLDINETQDVNEAVLMSLNHAEEGDVVLLSPACSSFDLFENYEDRGNRFKEAVRELKRGKSFTE